MTYDALVAARNSVIGLVYRKALKPVLFGFDPEGVHDAFTLFGRALGSNPVTRLATRAMFHYAHPALRQEVCGIRFANPIGLAAGFDKDAHLTDILPDVGFGFAEVGSVTGEPCAGNPKPRLWRLPRARTLQVYYGLKNEGCERIARRLAGKRFRIPVGASVAKTNSPATVDVDAGIADYAKAFATMEPVASYLTVNISCPNAFGGEPFTDPARLEKLFAVLDRIPTAKPVFIKLSPDLSPGELDALMAVLARHRVHGIICTNLTKKPGNPVLEGAEPPGKGGLSGASVRGLATSMIRYVRRATGGKYVIIGCGGVFDANDAYEKIRAGASLLQLITGMIFEGPQAISEINRGLVKLLLRDGFRNVAEAVGTDAGA